MSPWRRSAAIGRGRRTLAPPFDIDGRTVGDFLAWFAQQTGRSVVFGSPAAERLARETRLNGSIDLEPMQKLSAVLALTDLTMPSTASAS